MGPKIMVEPIWRHAAMHTSNHSYLLSFDVMVMVLLLSYQGGQPNHPRSKNGQC